MEEEAPNNQPTKKLVVVLGPTASGKTEFALGLAGKIPAEIVSCDSLLVYKGIDIGSAKPSWKERQQVPHHLIDVKEVTEPFHAADYVALADEAIAKIDQKKKVPILCGGTMLYARSLIFGLADIPYVPEQKQQEAERLFESLGQAGSLNFLREKGGFSFRYTDPQRLKRALAVFLTTGRNITDFQQQHKFANKRYQTLIFGMQRDRSELYLRINQRILSMFEKGWLEEVEGLLKLYSPELKPLQSIGYAEIVAYLLGKRAKQGLIEEIQKKTRHYAKRQITWWQRDAEIRWFTTWGAAEQETLERFLNSG